MGRRGTRPDAEGMTRQSYYISREAADALDAAVNTVRTTLGSEAIIAASKHWREGTEAMWSRDRAIPLGAWGADGYYED